MVKLQIADLLVAILSPRRERAPYAVVRRIGSVMLPIAKGRGLTIRHGNTRSRGGPPAHGSGVTERIARYAPCPVLTVRARGTHEEIEPLFMGERAAFGSVLGHHGTSRE